MGLSKQQHRILKSKSVPMEEDVQKALGTKHRALCMFIFSRVAESIRDLDLYYLPEVGSFGPYRKHVKSLCDKGLIREGKEAICDKL